MVVVVAAISGAPRQVALAGAEVKAVEAVESPAGGVLAVKVAFEPAQGAGVAGVDVRRPQGLHLAGVEVEVDGAGRV
jgi:hypothetical protein